jgi:hypothetical protein
VQLHQPDFLETLVRLDASLFVFSFAPLDRFQNWVEYFREHFLNPYYRRYNIQLPADPFLRTRFLADPDLSVYHSYGLGRNSPLRVYGPRIAWQYFKWGLVGLPLKRPKEDTLQRGGDFVVGRDGRLTLCHIGRDQADRPSVAEILAALSE